MEERWLTLTREILPALAFSSGWRITADHCFQRILLDNAFGGCWYDYVWSRPAYAHVPDTILAEAIELGEAILAGRADIAPLNAKSLDWRRRRRVRMEPYEPER